MLGVLVNPNAKKNRKRKNFRRELEKALHGRGVVIETPNVEAITDALHVFRDCGARYWIADGGDGALHWMINKACEAFGADWVADNIVFVPSNGGTIDYVARAIRLQGRSLEITSRLTATLDAGGVPDLVEVPSLRMDMRVGPDRHSQVVFGFGNAFGGYGANFYGPFYEGDAGRGPARIVAMVASGFAAAAGRGMLRGPLRRLKPQFMHKAEYDYLRPIVGGAMIDGVPLRDRHGELLTHFTVAQCASIKLELGGVFRVFPFAAESAMHAQLGHVSAGEMVVCMPGLMAGRSVSRWAPDAHDGPARTMSVWSDGESMTPILDGEVYEDVYRADVVAGPRFRMATP